MGCFTACRPRRTHPYWQMRPLGGKVPTDTQLGEQPISPNDRGESFCGDDTYPVSIVNSREFVPRFNKHGTQRRSTEKLGLDLRALISSSRTPCLAHGPALFAGRGRKRRRSKPAAA